MPAGTVHGTGRGPHELLSALKLLSGKLQRRFGLGLLLLCRHHLRLLCWNLRFGIADACDRFRKACLGLR